MGFADDVDRKIAEQLKHDASIEAEVKALLARIAEGGTYLADLVASENFAALDVIRQSKMDPAPYASTRFPHSDLGKGWLGAAGHKRNRTKFVLLQSGEIVPARGRIIKSVDDMGLTASVMVDTGREKLPIAWMKDGYIATPSLPTKWEESDLPTLGNVLDAMTETAVAIRMGRHQRTPGKLY